MGGTRSIGGAISPLDLGGVYGRSGGRGGPYWRHRPLVDPWAHADCNALFSEDLLVVELDCAMPGTMETNSMSMETDSVRIDGIR